MRGTEHKPYALRTIPAPGWLRYQFSQRSSLWRCRWPLLLWLLLSGELDIGGPARYVHAPLIAKKLVRLRLHWCSDTAICQFRRQQR